jgi:membrane protease YdiL (CAAX protease family)
MSSETPDTTSPATRHVAVLLFVAAWMAAGWLLRLDVNTYLVLGVPLTVLFQRLVRRRPLRALWVREAPPISREWKGIAATALSVVPLLSLAGAAVDGDWGGILFGLCSLVGAVGAAYALRHFRREHVRPLFWCLLITLSLDAIQWSLFFRYGVVEMHPVEGGIAERVAVGVFSFLQYIPVVFVMEEVSFRMLDSHLHEADLGRGVLSAVWISVLWGLWHLPNAGEMTWQSIGLLMYVHVPYGVALSLFWRKTGNLLVPGLCHALGDAIRNGLTAGG